MNYEGRNDYGVEMNYESQNKLRGSKRIMRVETNYEGRNELRGETNYEGQNELRGSK